MKLNSNRYRLVTSFCLMFVMCLSAIAMTPVRADKEKLTADEVVAKHLAAIGTPEARAAVKTIVGVGTVVSTLRGGGSGSNDGQVAMASAQNRNLLGINYNVSNYRSESMAYDGKELSWGEIKPGFYSQIVQFMKRSDMPMREGTMGGVLSTAWPLLDVAGRKVKLKYDGVKKLDGRECYVLKYEGKNTGGLKTSMYFDAETFQHVRTEYERRQAQIGAAAAGVTQDQQDSITKLTESFSNFSAENGLMLPHTYSIELSLLSNNKSYIQNWEIKLGNFVFNKELADSEFVVGGDVKGK